MSHGKNSFNKVSKNLAIIYLKIILFGPNNYVGHSNWLLDC